MPAYVFANVEVLDPQAFGEYRRGVASTVEKYGGKTLVRGTEIEVLEGDWEPAGFILIEFADRDALMRWYDSEDYRELKELRQRVTRSSVVTMVGA